ncbi:hypothetical protein [Xanthomonas phage X1]|nr:hypothetical protein [Xanthomonas phage X1]
MSNAKLQRLEEELYEKLREIQDVAVETNTPFSFSINYHTYDVFLPDHEDEDMVEYLKEEVGVEVGDWVSSSDRC